MRRGQRSSRGCLTGCPCRIPFWDGYAKTVFSTGERIVMVEMKRWGRRVWYIERRQEEGEGTPSRAPESPLS